MRTASKALLRILNQARYALRFSGPTQKLPFVLSMPAGQVSYEAWVRPRVGAGLHYMARSNNFAAGVAGCAALRLSAAEQPQFVLVDTGGTTRIVNGASNLAAEAPSHMVGTYDGANHSIYVNGASVGSSSAASGTALTGTGVDIGILSAGDNCMVDDVRVYNRALSAAEVAQRYAGRHIQNGLILWSGFDEGSGATAYDYSGAGLTAAIPAGPTYEAFNGWPGLEESLFKADLYTFYSAGGTVLGRWTDADANIPVGGNTWYANGPVFERDQIKVVAGLEVDDLSFTVGVADDTMTIGGYAWMRALRDGLLDGGRVLLEQFISDDPTNTGVGKMIKFGGRVGPIQRVGRSSARVTVKSDLNLLDISMPRNAFQPGCRFRLYDTQCAANSSIFSRAATVQSGSDSWTIKTTLGSPLPTDYFALGRVVFVDGPNAGLSRPIRSFNSSSGDITLARPAFDTPANGNSITVYAGCDKLLTTCGVKRSDTFTANASTDVITCNAHGLSDCAAVKFTSTVTLPPPLVAGTPYFVRDSTTNTFKVSTTPGAAALNITGAGSGTHSLTDSGKFANRDNFGGQPFVPPPEAII